VSGELSDGTMFEGTDTIRVIDKHGHRQRQLRIRRLKNSEFPLPKK
jgi:hypothetical protein